MPRDRNLGPFPFRLGAGAVAATEPTLAQALKCWWNWEAWSAEIHVVGGSFPMRHTVRMSRQTSVNTERMQRPVDDDAQTGNDAFVGSPHFAEGFGEEPRKFSYRAGMFIFSRGLGPYITPETRPELEIVPSVERGVWSGRHVVAKRAQLVQGRVAPTVAFEMIGFRPFSSSYFFDLSTLAPRGDFAFSLTVNLPGGGALTRSGFGAVEDGVEPPRSFSVVLTPVHFLFANASGPIYAADGTQLKDPLKSRVP